MRRGVFGWSKPMHVEHFRAIGLVRRALKKGCRSLAEICEETKLFYDQVLSALEYLANDEGLEIAEEVLNDYA